MEKIPIDQIRHVIGVQTTITDDIERRQLTWYGHFATIFKGDSLKKYSTRCQSRGKREEGQKHLE